LKRKETENRKQKTKTEKENTTSNQLVIFGCVASNSKLSQLQQVKKNKREQFFRNQKETKTLPNT